MLVGEICRLGPGSRVLDLAGGKAEMPCQSAARSGVTGVGVDIYPPLMANARARAGELGVADVSSFSRAMPQNP